MSIVQLVDTVDAERRARAAEQLRELAAEVERGDVADFVVVWDNRVENFYASYGHFDDRWRILGALEYAKASVHKQV